MQTRHFSCAAALLLLMALPAPALAQCYLSEAEVWADVIQINGLRWILMDGVGGSWVRTSAATQMHDGDYSEAYVQSEAWVNPGGTPGVATNGKGTPQWASGIINGNVWGAWTGNSKHWYVNLAYPSRDYYQWIQIDALGTSINLGSPPPPTEPEECAASGGQWNYETGECEYPNCPIIVDLDGNGYRLSGVSDGVVFDIDADGMADAIGWTELGESDAFLVWDRNANGLIDDGSELFGTATSLSGGGRAANGFAALADLDSNGDGLIDHRDEGYARLQLWIDENHNGISERPELKNLSDVGLTTLYLGDEMIGRRDRQGNLFRFKGTVLVEKRGVERTRRAFDVFLVRQ